MARTPPIRPGHVPAEAYPLFLERVTDYVVLFLDVEGRICSWNEGARRTLGYEPGEVVGRSASLLHPSVDVASRRPEYELRVATEEGRFEDEGWRVRKDGSMFWASVVLTAVRDDEGLLGFALVARDMTHRMHVEESLRQSEERHRIMTASVKDYAIFMLDPQGRVQSWNEGAQRLKGWRAEEIIGRHFRTFYEEGDRQRRHPEEELEIALREGRYEEEGWRVRKDGTRFWASVTITTMRDGAGRHIGFAKVTRDLTARRMAEERLRQQAASYADLNRELDAFAHTVAHDLRAPIRAVAHLSDILLAEAAPKLDDASRQNLSAIHESAEHMASLVQSLLDLSTSARRDPRRIEVDVSRLAAEIVDDLRARDPERAVEVRVQPGMHARADEGLARVALGNILANAFKFTRDRKPGRVEVGVAQTSRGRAFFVRDNGVGFDPDDARQLFEPFSRLGNAKGFEGTGIGLATVQRIVRRHGGEVWAEGKPDQGATFWFTLPDPAAQKG